MTPLRSRVAQVCALLNAQEARYLVVGATAMQLWGSSRSTRDIDIRIDPTLENAERVLRALSDLAFGVAKEIEPQALLTRGVTMIGDTPNVDVLTPCVESALGGGGYANSEYARTACRVRRRATR